MMSVWDALIVLGPLLMTAGVYCVFIFLVLLAIKTITKTSKKNVLKGLTAGVIAFAIGFVLLVVSVIPTMKIYTSEAEAPIALNSNPAPIASPEPTASPEPVATPEPTPVEPTASPSLATASEIMAQMEAALKDRLDNYTVEGDETGITVNLAMNGTAELLEYAFRNGYDETYDRGLLPEKLC